MKDLGDFVKRLVDHLDRAQVPYMLAGSVASTFHGMPRSTQDVDVVVVLGSSSLNRFLAELPDDAFYVSGEAAFDALHQNSQFNVIDLESGWKADLILQKQRPFSVSEFRRRMRAEVLGVEAWLATAEDTIISKLEWGKRAGGSERQLRDVVGVIEVIGDGLDRGYIENWADELGIGDLWREAEEAAGS